VKLSRLGFGISGPHTNGFVSRSTTQRLIHHAIEAGVTFFDTAPFYGAQAEGEVRLAGALRGHLNKSDLVISTKAGTTRDANGWRKDFSPNAIKAQVDASLERLGRVDILFLHGPAEHDWSTERTDFLDDLRARKIVRAIGVAGRGAEIDHALDRMRFDFLMCPVAGPDTPNRLTEAAQRGIGLIAIETMRHHTASVRLSLRPADLWYSARALRDRAFGKPSAPTFGIKAALEVPGVVSVLATTTRRPHLARNIEASLDAVPAGD
jgi:aryl-alcohol dehydrogenase-like predicted oxidoreductase